MKGKNMKFEKLFESKISTPDKKSGEGKTVAKKVEESLLLFEKVKNKVAFVNDEINAPLKLEKGKESPLGLFAKAALNKEYKLKPDEQRLESWSEHHRSALLGKVIFNDKNGRLYRDIDVKGIGYIDEENVFEPGGPTNTSAKFKFAKKLPVGDLGEREGFLQRFEAFLEHEGQEKLIKAGVRTSRTLAIINLEEIVFNGKKISLEEAKNRKIFGKRYQPVVEVRAFGTKARIRDIRKSKDKNENKEWQKFLLDDAKKIVSKEIGKDLSLDKDYLKWFAKTLGENVARMHKNGLWHGYLGDHNITLDCRIVDTENVMHFLSRTGRGLDISWAKKSLKSIVDSLGFKKNFYEFENQFSESYNNVFLPDSVKNSIKKRQDSLHA